MKVNHNQVKVLSFDAIAKPNALRLPTVKVDEHMTEVLEAIWKMGINTTDSCQGDGGSIFPNAYIFFTNRQNGQWMYSRLKDLGFKVFFGSEHDLANNAVYFRHEQLSQITGAIKQMSQSQNS